MAEAGNGIEGLEAVRKYHPDLLICDIRMPKMDGLTLVNKMEELSQKPVVIVLSGYDEFSYAVEMMKHGVRDYILKPIKRETIEQLLEIWNESFRRPGKRKKRKNGAF